MSVVVLAMFDVCAVSRPNCGHARLPTSILASPLRYRLVFPRVVRRKPTIGLVGNHHNTRSRRTIWDITFSKQPTAILRFVQPRAIARMSRRKATAGSWRLYGVQNLTWLCMLVQQPNSCVYTLEHAPTMFAVHANGDNARERGTGVLALPFTADQCNVCSHC